MRDPMTFDDRLADAFARYTAAAPTDVDARSLAAGLAATRRPRWAGLPAAFAPRPISLRLLVLVGLLALALVAGLLAAGAFVHADKAPLGGGGRILAWLPDEGGGTAHLLGTDGVGRASLTLPTSTCPTLLADADAIGVAVQRNPGDVRFTSLLTGKATSLPIPGAGFQLWSANHGAYAMVDIVSQAISVVAFPDGDIEHPKITRYESPRFGAGAPNTYGAFSWSTAKLALPVVIGTNSVAIHVFADGIDTTVATVFTGDSLLAARLMWGQGDNHIAIVTSDAGLGLLTVVNVSDGAVRQFGGPVSGLDIGQLEPVGMSPDGRYVIVQPLPTDRAWILDTAQGRWQALDAALTRDTSMRWSADGRLAMIIGATVVVRSFDGSPDRIVNLPGDVAAWSPDGTAVVSLVTGAGQPATLWATGVWQPDKARQIATIAPSGRGPALAGDSPCVQWLPEVRP
jgi:hypothetical protein